MTTKTRKQFKHTKLRFQQRFDLKYHKDLKAQIVKKIQEGHAVPIGSRSNRVKRFIVNNIKGLNLVVIYDNKRKSIITAWEKK